MDREALKILMQLFNVGDLFSEEEFLKRLKLWLQLERKDNESAISHYSERLLDSIFVKKYYFFGGKQNKIKQVKT